MYNSQFDRQRNSSVDIEQRLRMEEFDITHSGLPDDDTNLIQLLRDAKIWIRQAKVVYSIPENWLVDPEIEDK